MIFKYFEYPTEYPTYIKIANFYHLVTFEISV